MKRLLGQGKVKLYQDVPGFIENYISGILTLVVWTSQPTQHHATLVSWTHAERKNWDGSNKDEGCLVIILIHLNYSSLTLPKSFHAMQLWQTFEFLQMSLRLWDFTICQGDAFHPSPWQTSEREEDRRVESEEEEKMCCREENGEGPRGRGRKHPVIHSNTSSTLFPQPNLANSTSSGLLQKEGFEIRVFSVSDSWLFTLAAN